jgi:hypothetical protein
MFYLVLVSLLLNSRIDKGIAIGQSQEATKTIDQEVRSFFGVVPSFQKRHNEKQPNTNATTK